jgi:glutamate N-acetyltransferase/amino-acid N-acetyltransferase
MSKGESGVTAAKGFMAGGLHCGIKKNGGMDLAMIVSEREAAAAGVFTRNLVKGAPVALSMAHIKKGKIKGIVVNSGNANVMTPSADKDAMTMATRAAGALGVQAGRMLTASTGVIGRSLPIDLVSAGIGKLAGLLAPSGGRDAALAIMTTDTFPKEAHATAVIGGKRVTVGGMAKGSGMIHPNMATMLAFVTTDTAVAPAVLRTMVRRANENSFNSITVDGATSTSDMFIVLANGASGAPLISSAKGKDYEALLAALTKVAAELARMVVQDGEGATKFITVRVTGARSDREAKLGAMEVAKSSLVKTAMFGKDPNWGRALCALGHSGAIFDPRKARLSLCGVPVFKNGFAISGGVPAGLTAKLEKKEIEISADLGAGVGRAVVWTCDMSYDYVRINAEYTT